MTTEPPAMTPRGRGEPVVELMKAPGDSVTPPSVTSSRLILVEIGETMLMFPVSDGVPLMLRYPTCSTAADEMLSRSDCMRLRLPDGAGVPSTTEVVGVTGPSTTPAGCPGAAAVIVPPCSAIASARITISAAAGGEEEVLLIM